MVQFAMTVDQARCVWRCYGNVVLEDVCHQWVLDIIVALVGAGERELRSAQAGNNAVHMLKCC